LLASREIAGGITIKRLQALLQRSKRMPTVANLLRFSEDYKKLTHRVLAESSKLRAATMESSQGIAHVSQGAAPPPLS
jgi:hypothetical protein